MITSLGVVSSVRHSRHALNCGGLGATGFAVLFNVGYRGVPWCAASGALALALRTVALGEGWSLEAASFVAAMAVGIAVQLLPSSIGISRDALHVVGCIPMIPGAFAAKAMLGLFRHYDAAFDHHQWNARRGHGQYFARDFYHGGPWNRSSHPHHSAARAYVEWAGAD